MKKLSIIIPQSKEPNGVVGKLLSSINDQGNVDYSSIETIVINDLTMIFPSPEYLETFSNLNARFYQTGHVFGPGPVRQVGIDKAEGEWIMFCDADDFLYPCSLRKILDYIDAASESTNLINMRYIKAEENGDMDLTHRGKTGVQVYARLYRKSYLIANNIKFSPYLHTFYEDTYFMHILQATLNPGQILDYDAVVYVKCDNAASMGGNVKGDLRVVKLLCIYNQYTNSLRLILEWVAEHRPEQLPHELALCFYNTYTHYRMMSTGIPDRDGSNSGVYTSYRKEVWDFMRATLKKYFTGYMEMCKNHSLAGVIEEKHGESSAPLVQEIMDFVIGHTEGLNPGR